MDTVAIVVIMCGCVGGEVDIENENEATN